MCIYPYYNDLTDMDNLDVFSVYSLYRQYAALFPDNKQKGDPLWVRMR